MEMEKNTKNTDRSRKAGRLAEALQGRLVYMALQCPLVQQGACACKTGLVKGQDVKGYEPGELVTIHVALPYELRQEARQAKLNCSALLREVLRRRLRKLQNA